MSEHDTESRRLAQCPHCKNFMVAHCQCPEPETYSSVGMGKFVAGLTEIGAERQGIRHEPHVSEQESERDRLLHALKVVLPMAKAYAHIKPEGRNAQIVRWAECIAENPKGLIA